MKIKFVSFLMLITFINCNKKNENLSIQNDSFLDSGFYQDTISKKYFFKYKYYGIDEKKNNIKYVSTPIILTNGDTLNDIDISSFRSINNFYVDKKYFFKIISQADYCSVVAEPIDKLKPGCYYEKSYYVNFNDSIYYESPEGKACNGLIGFLANSGHKKEFNVLDIQNIEEDFAVLDTILIVNGCIINSIDDLEVDNNFKNKIMSAIKFKKFKKPYCFTKKS